MKNHFLPGVLLLCVLMLARPAAAADTSAAKNTAVMIRVGLENKELDLTKLPLQPYQDGDVWMVPLRLISEALGYQVSWDKATGAVTVDDGHIQKATLYNGTEKVAFEGHLKNIDMSRTIENAVSTVIHDGYTYVPLVFFSELLNDVSVEDRVITVAPSMSEINTASN